MPLGRNTIFKNYSSIPGRQIISLIITFILENSIDFWNPAMLWLWAWAAETLSDLHRTLWAFRVHILHKTTGWHYSFSMYHAFGVMDSRQLSQRNEFQLNSRWFCQARVQDWVSTFTAWMYRNRNVSFCCKNNSPQCACWCNCNT